MSSGFLDPSHCDDRKNKVHVFFHPKTNFQPIFDKKKTLKKHPRNLVKPIHDPKKHKKKKSSKPKINPKQKIFLSYDLLFRHFQGKKKTHSSNSSHYMESFSIKIYRLWSKSSLTSTFALYMEIRWVPLSPTTQNSIFEH